MMESMDKIERERNLTGAVCVCVCFIWCDFYRYGIRHVANSWDAESAYEWQWWIDIADSGNGVGIKWTASNITATDSLRDMIAELPDYVNPIPITTYMHQFEC